MGTAAYAVRVSVTTECAVATGAVANTVRTGPLSTQAHVAAGKSDSLEKAAPRVAES